MKKIFLIDDSAEIIKVTKLILKKIPENCSLKIAFQDNTEDSPDAIFAYPKFISSKYPHFLKLAKDNLTKTIIIFEEESDYLLLQGQGFQHFIKKPFTIKNAISILGNVLASPALNILPQNNSISFTNKKELPPDIKNEFVDEIKQNVSLWIDKEIEILARAMIKEEIKKILESPL
ncbi:MAG: hypothetical protein K2X39_00450 [Silvanigrellaceae bacterium]|nr:hypothetical protein [Silvanigrellaceae bacterium]